MTRQTDKIIPKLFALTFAVILMSGSIPLGFSESIATPLQFSSPRVQLENGVEPKDVQCKENHVLVLRTNGNPACVSERTAERTGWEIISTSTITEISTTLTPAVIIPEYEFPMLRTTSSSGGGNGEEQAEPFATHEVSISNLPKIGETSTVILTMTLLKDNNGYHRIYLSGGLEFVDLPKEKISKRGIFTQYTEHIDLLEGDSFVMVAQVKATKEGEASIQFDEADYYNLYVTANRTYLQDDYYKMHPKPQSDPVEEWGVPPADHLGSGGTTTIGNSTDIIFTEEQLRAYLIRNDVSAKEIEEIIDYTIRYKKTSDSKYMIHYDDMSTSTNSIIPYLESNTKYDFVIDAINTSGTSTVTSDVFSIDTKDNSSIVLSWSSDLKIVNSE